METNDCAEKTIQELVNKKKSLKNEIKFLTNNKIKDYHVSRYTMGPPTFHEPSDNCVNQNKA